MQWGWTFFSWDEGRASITAQGTYEGLGQVAESCRILEHQTPSAGSWEDRLVAATLNAWPISTGLVFLGIEDLMGQQLQDLLVDLRVIGFA